jgi:hypothetical protein
LQSSYINAGETAPEKNEKSKLDLISDKNVQEKVKQIIA